VWQRLVGSRLYGAAVSCPSKTSFHIGLDCLDRSIHSISLLLGGTRLTKAKKLLSVICKGRPHCLFLLEVRGVILLRERIF